MSTSLSAAVRFLPPIAAPTQSSPRAMREEELLQLLDEHEKRKAAEQQPWHKREEEEEEEKQPIALCPSAQPTVDPTAAMERTQLSATLPFPSRATPPASTLSTIAGHLPFLLDSPFSSPASQRAVEWMWLLLHDHPHDAVTLLTSHHVLTRLSSWTDDALRRCKGRAEKQRRNNLVALLASLAQHAAASAPFAHCGLVQMALTHATHSEHRSGELHGGLRGWTADEADVEEESKEPLVLTSTGVVSGECRWTQSSDVGDLELRQLLWGLLATLSSHWICHALVHQGRLLSALLHYVDAGATPLFHPAASSPTPTGVASYHWLHRRWSPSQLLELQRSALSALLVVAPSMSEQFVALQGVERLVCFVQTMAGGSDLGGVAAATAQAQALQSLAVKAIAAVLEAAYATPWHPELDPLLLGTQPTPSSTPFTASPSASDSAPCTASLPFSRPSTLSGAASSTSLFRLSTPARLSVQVTVRTLLSVVLDSAVPLDCRADAMSGLTSLGAEQPEVQRLMRRERCVELLSSMLNDERLMTTLVAHCPPLVAHMVSAASYTHSHSRLLFFSMDAWRL